MYVHDGQTDCCPCICSVVDLERKIQFHDIDIDTRYDAYMHPDCVFRARRISALAPGTFVARSEIMAFSRTSFTVHIILSD